MASIYNKFDTKPHTYESQTQNTQGNFPESAAVEVSTSSKLCACAPLHYLCDPQYCYQASIRKNLSPDQEHKPYLPIEITFNALKQNAEHGCRICSTIYSGLTTPPIVASMEREFGINTLHLGQLAVFIHNNYGTVSVSNDSVEFTIDFKSNAPIRNSSKGCQVFALVAVSESTATRSTFDQIWNWMIECKEHSGCSDVFASSLLPSRVLDVSNAPEVRLVETDGNMKGLYFTLSHCWGKSVPLTTKRATLKSMTKGIEWSLLPRTFQDAITIAQKLCATYLWIDSLCIIQDDARDWEIESANMHAIYANSALTIAASHAEDSREGCFAMTKDLSMANYHLVQAPGENNSIAVRMARSLGHDILRDRPFRNLGHLVDFKTQPLLYRGWAFQERLLSQRVLYYTNSEVVWECQTRVQCQCKCIQADIGKSSIKNSLFRTLQNRRGSEPRIYQWLRVIEEFSVKNLTYPSDRLPALSGLAKVFGGSASELGTYLAGLWTHELALSLIWRPSTSHDDGRLADSPYVAPTWSWASLNGPVFFSCSDELKTDERLQIPYVDIIEASCTPATPDPTGKVSAGHLRVTGNVVPTRLTYKHWVYGTSSRGTSWWLSSNQTLEETQSGILFAPDANPFSGLPMEHDARGTMDGLCLLFSTTAKLEELNADATNDDDAAASGNDDSHTTYVMVLRPSSIIIDAYERFGIRHFDNLQTVRRLFAKGEMRTVTII